MPISKSNPLFSDKVRFIAESEKDLDKLDGSSLRQVAKAINKVATNPAPRSNGGFGKPLRNSKDAALAGFNKIKLKKSGIGVVYRVLERGGEMLVVIISARADGYVYDEAAKRIEKHGLR